jgi:hypothetical protein
MIEENFNGATFRLVTEDDMQPVSLNDPIENFRGEPDVLRNATCPRHGASSGHVNGYYAHVYGLKWVEVLDYNQDLMVDCEEDFIDENNI